MLNRKHPSKKAVKDGMYLAVSVYKQTDLGNLDFAISTSSAQQAAMVWRTELQFDIRAMYGMAAMSCLETLCMFYLYCT